MEKTATKVERTDIREITRYPDLCRTTVRLFPSWDDREAIDWLIAGQGELRHHEKRGTWELLMRLTEGVTDFEHDSAYAFQLPLIGLTFDSLYYHQTTFVAWVDPNDFENFRVPRPGYNPMKLPGAYCCKDKDCRREDPKGHMIVPEDNYAGPMPDRELFQAVRGKRVEIKIGPFFKEE